MKKILVILVFSSTAFCLGQQIGIGLGTAVFNAKELQFGDPTQPKILSGNVAVDLSSDVKIGFTAGYGFEKVFRNVESDIHFGDETRMDGFQAELELLASKPLVILSSIRAFVGLGFGYYRYGSTETIQTGEDRKEYESDLAGPAQYFTFGLNYRLSRRMSALLQFKRLGFSGIEVDMTSPAEMMTPKSTTKISVKSEPGLGDLSITVGIFLNLHPGDESSFIEQLREH